MICSVQECNNNQSRKKLCNAHYLRLRRHGSVAGGKHLQKISCSHYDRNGIKIDWQHPLYNCYVGMIDRCSNPKNVKYKIYGGRGIFVSDEWKGICGFHNFIESMPDRPDKHSLDRIDVNLDYTPGNCRWASIHQQNSNKRSNRKFVGVYKSNDKRNKAWRTSLTIKGIEMAGKSFETEDEAISYILKLRGENNIYVG